jgi:hypothetical protein
VRCLFVRPFMADLRPVPSFVCLEADIISAEGIFVDKVAKFRWEIKEVEHLLIALGPKPYFSVCYYTSNLCCGLS